MNFEAFKNKVLEALAQIGLDIKSKANDSEVVKSVTGDGVDNTDPQNPIVKTATFESQNFTYSEGSSQILNLGDYFQILTVEVNNRPLVEGTQYNPIPPSQVEITDDLEEGDIIVVKLWKNGSVVLPYNNLKFELPQGSGTPPTEVLIGDAWIDSSDEGSIKVKLS